MVTESGIGTRLEVEDIVNIILKSSRKGKIVKEYINEFMSGKETEEGEVQR